MQQDSNQKTIIIATLAFIVGFGLAWLISTNKAGYGITSGTGVDAINQASTTANFVSVKDQNSGVTVALEQVQLEKLGWVVIHDEDNGAPGRILGAQLFDAGSWTDGTVDLLRGTLSGKMYYAMLHSDNGDHAFDPKSDTPILGEDGKSVMAKFSTMPDSGTDQN